MSLDLICEGVILGIAAASLPSWGYEMRAKANSPWLVGKTKYETKFLPLSGVHMELKYLQAFCHMIPYTVV